MLKAAIAREVALTPPAQVDRVVTSLKNVRLPGVKNAAITTEQLPLTHEALGHTVAPLYIFCDISGTGRATSFELCIASNEQLGHI